MHLRLFLPVVNGGIIDMGSSLQRDGSFLFGPFSLRPRQHLLLEAGRPLPLGSRALPLLLALVERAGEVVSKDDLIARAWPGLVVDEGNLRVHVAGLRRVLRDGRDGNRYIQTVSGRGYSFVAPVRFVPAGPADAPPPPVEREVARDLPSTVPRLFGRDATVALLCARLPEVRFLTLVGPGGIGKTTVALAVARGLAPSYRHGVVFVDFSAVGDGTLVPSTIFAALGLATTSQDMVPALLAFLSARSMLLVLDNCEHVIEVAAGIAERISAAAPDVHILCTSREPLRADGEHVHALQPLEVPGVTAGLTAAEALTYACIQLFVDRTSAALHGFTLTDEDAPVAAEICRRLDGIALAIEFAAGRVVALGVREVAQRLDDRFRMLTSGRRTALPRQQTLLATLDWSFDLLPPAEQDLLCRLAVFAGEFSLDAAVAVAGHADAPSTVDHVGDLVAKSLLVADIRRTSVSYRLLDSIRLYALEKLRARGQLADAAHRHARHVLDLVTDAAPAVWSFQIGDRGSLHAKAIDDVRAALAWACSAAGDRRIGIGLTVAFAPVWIDLSLMSECQGNVERALGLLPGSGLSAAETLDCEMRLYSALANVLLYKGEPASVTNAVWSGVVERAQRLGNVEHSLRGIWGIWVGRIDAGAFREALTLARKFCALAARGSDPVEPLIGQRMIGAALHLLGDQAGARRHLENVLRGHHVPLHHAGTVRTRDHPHLRARMRLAVVLWLQGWPDRAMQAVEAAVAEAVAGGHAATIAGVLAQGACHVALARGDLEAACRFVAMLLDVSDRHEHRLLHIVGRCYEGTLLARQGEVARGLGQLRREMDRPEVVGHGLWFTGFLCYAAEAHEAAGDIAMALTTIDAALERSARLEEGWCRAEILRLKARLALRRGLPEDPAMAEALLQESLATAAGQAALSWELRSATTLAQLRRDQGRAAEARALLAPVYARLTEGFATADPRTARAVLDELAGGVS